jgi:hypothetical protein
MVVGESGGIIKIIAPKVDADRKPGGVKEKGSKVQRGPEGRAPGVVSDKLDISSTVKEVLAENRLAAQNGLEDFEAANRLMEETIGMIKENGASVGEIHSGPFSNSILTIVSV